MNDFSTSKRASQTAYNLNTTFIREITLKYGRKVKAARQSITEPEEAALFIRAVLPDNVREHFVCLFLDGSNAVVAYSIIATGTASTCPVHPREVFQPAILAGACRIIVAHNHPSGSIKPSSMDCDVTRNLKAASLLLGIPILEHLIVTDDHYYSFHEHGSI